MYLTYQQDGRCFGMKIRRNFLRTVELRVQQHRTGQRAGTSYQLGRLHSLESLAADYHSFKDFVPVERTDEISSL